VGSALDAVITMDHLGRIVEFNPAAERVFGYQTQDVLGRDLADLIIPPDLRDAHRQGLARQLSSGPGRMLGRRTELNAMRADGSLFAAEVSITAVDGPGRPLFTGFVRDISQRVEAEAERAELEQRVHQTERLESLGQLAGGIAHDFNNLLTVILNSASFITESQPDEHETAKADAERIVRAAEGAARLTKQLLTFARREPVHHGPVDLNGVVAEIQGLLSRTIGADVQLSVEAADGLPFMNADRGQVEQVLLNLAVNARDAMPTGGTLTIETAVTDLDDDYTRLHPGVRPGRYVQLSVSDTGVGMSAEVASRAYEPFFTTKPKGEGSGLGLATVYGIVAEAGGTINLYTEEGLGTTIRAYFPVAPSAAAEQPITPSSARIRGTGQTILVVEDQDAVRDVTVAMLRRNGYLVLEASGAQQALELASEKSFDLLLTDVVMPERSGRELAEDLGRSVPSLRVLFMSGYSHGVLGPNRALDPGLALIQKPFSAVALLRAVHEALTTEPGREE
jgi:hypothetical protein